MNHFVYWVQSEFIISVELLAGFEEWDFKKENKDVNEN